LPNVTIIASEFREKSPNASQPQLAICLEMHVQNLGTASPKLPIFGCFMRYHNFNKIIFGTKPAINKWETSFSTV